MLATVGLEATVEVYGVWSTQTANIIFHRSYYTDLNDRPKWLQYEFIFTSKQNIDT